MTPGDELLTKRDIAEALKIPVSAVDRLATAGRIPIARRVGKKKHMRFVLADVVEALSPPKCDACGERIDGNYIVRPKALANGGTFHPKCAEAQSA